MFYVLGTAAVASVRMPQRIQYLRGVWRSRAAQCLSSVLAVDAFDWNAAHPTRAWIRFRI